MARKKRYDANYINYLLRKNGSSQAAIAESFTPEITRQAVNNVIHGRRRNERIRKAIAEVIGIEVNEIWPDAA